MVLSWGDDLKEIELFQQYFLCIMRTDITLADIENRIAVYFRRAAYKIYTLHFVILS